MIIECTTVYAWVLVSLLFLVFEIGVPGLFYFLSCSCGSLAAAGAAWFEFSLTTQGAVFLIASLASICILRRWVKTLNMHDAEKETNVYALKGKQGVVVQEAAGEYCAQVRVTGQYWAASSVDETVLKVGMPVIIVRVSGTRLFVKTNS